MTVHKLVPRPTASDEARESVVTLLREVLEEAEAGKIDTIAMIIGHTDGDWSSRATQTENLSEAIGRLEMLKHDWIRSVESWDE